jgi:radical SAM protein with 4Fe4S-binding SPASM domain
MSFLPGDRIHAPKLTLLRRGATHIAVDAEGPNWAATDERGARVLAALDRPRSVAELEALLTERDGGAKAWLEIDTLLGEAERAGMVRREPFADVPYPGRADLLGAARLEEMWIHINDYCNLRCAHCLVSSGPELGRGLPPETVRDVARQAYALGARTFLITGGEPLFRNDLPDLLGELLADGAARAVILTNGFPLRSDRLDRLAALLRERLLLQISLDGPDAATNDAVRGAGTFGAILDGIRAAVGAGFGVTVSTVVTTRSAPVLERMAPLCADLGVNSLHLLWPHRRGRASVDGLLPSPAAVVDAYRRLLAGCRQTGVALDNEQALRLRLDAPPGTKHDLSGAGLKSLCLYTDGRIYPSAALAGVAELAMGDTARESLESIWRDSIATRRLRSLSVVDKAQCRGCEWRFLCGGGDIEHGWFFSGSLLGDDPYCALHKEMIGGVLEELAVEAGRWIGRCGGFARPVLARTMGERALACGVDVDGAVATTRSACVLSVDVLDRSRALMRDFYGRAAEQPQAGLCCPVKPDAADLTHIPAEVVERFYGCGSPVSDAAIAEGETVVDLGSGAGIDCFVAARKVGATGRVVGIDMTDAMIDVATRNREPVARNLGWDVVEFRKGLLEEVPVPSATVDLVVSNCVVNLSPDKRRVFSEMWRILRDGGRAVLADIVSEGELPAGLKVSVHLWGECLGGALSEREFLAAIERAGFFGIEILRKSFWKEVEGRRFFSLAVRAYKHAKRQGCVYAGHRAVYLGPLKAGIDEEGHVFPRGEPVVVCTDTAARLRAPAYARSFVVLDPGPESDAAGCDPSAGCC